MAVPPRLTSLVAWVVVLVWASSMILDALILAYDPPLSVHAAMMAVVGGTFGVQVIRRHQPAEPDPNDRREP